MPRSQPARSGPSTSNPELLTKSELRNQIASTATAKASVTTASWSPRTRTAGSPNRTPITVAPRAATMGAIGNGNWTSRSGTRHVVLIGPRMNPATPARVSWASDTCPVKPVTTT